MASTFVDGKEDDEEKWQNNKSIEEKQTMQ